MNQIGTVFTAEFMRRITSRPYLIATVIGVLGVLAIALLPRLLTSSFGGGPDRLVLVGDAALTMPAASLLRRDFLVVETITRLDRTPDAEWLDAHHRAASAIILTRNGRTLHVVAYAKDAGIFDASVSRALLPLQVSIATNRDIATTRRDLHVPIVVHDVSGKFHDAGDALAAKGIGYLFVILLYLSIILNAQAIMGSVAEEKTSRIAELLVATLDPAQLLAGKVLAATATGTIQLLIWMATGALFGQAITGMFGGATQAGTVAAGQMPTFAPLLLPAGEAAALLAFFLVGFVQFAVLYAAAASLINRTEDLGAVTGPLVIPVMAGFFVAQFALQSPNDHSVVVCSMVPLISPFVMFSRIAVASVPLWQIFVSLAVNIVSAILLALIAGRIYRVGLLLYGRPPSMRQVITALRG
jgi:ABC-2 type transport system permease protein